MLPIDFDTQLMFQPEVAAIVAAASDYSSGQLLSPVRQGAKVPVVHDSCADVDVLGKGSSANEYSPVGVVLEKLEYRWDKKSAWYNTPSDVKASIKVFVLDSPEHGRFVPTEGTPGGVVDIRGNRGFH